MTDGPEFDADAFVVVCTELHAAVGPYQHAEEALNAAERLTREDSCVYVPVPLAFRGEVVTRDEFEQRRGGKKDDHRPGQYL